MITKKEKDYLFDLPEQKMKSTTKIRESLQFL